jgi:hypothetical protein
MRRFSLPSALVVVLASALAFAAAPVKKEAQLAPLGISTISGDARAQDMKGETRVQGHLDGLTAGTQYELRISADACGGIAGTVVATFTANQAGKANFNELVAQPIVDINSLSVNEFGDPAVLSCGNLQ